MKLLSALLAVFLPLASFAGEGWTEDFEQAKKLATKEQRLILMDFTGSDWCQPCKLLHKKYYDAEEFKAFANKKLVLVKVDFPLSSEQSKKQKAANEKLSDEFKVQGFPTTIIVDLNGKELFRELGLPEVDLAGYMKRLKALSTKHLKD